MTNTKWFLRSKMIWGLIFIACGMYGIEFPPHVQEILPGLTVDTMNGIIEWVGYVMLAFGARNQKDKKLTVLPKKQESGGLEQELEGLEELPWKNRF